MEKTSKQKLSEFKQAAGPLMKLLNDNYHPHVTAIITTTSIELLEGLCADPKIYDFVNE